MNAHALSPNNFALKAGLFLISFTLLFWLGVTMEQLLNFPFIVEKIFLPIDELSAWLSIMLVVVFPLMAIVINLKSLMLTKFSIDRNEIVMSVNIKKSAAQWLLIAYASCSIALVMLYALFENFMFEPIHV
jgi:hypothetical protein